MGYFKKVNFIFLFVGHTKNSADMLFNALKMKYHREDIHTMAEMIEILDNSNSVTLLGEWCLATVVLAKK